MTWRPVASDYLPKARLRLGAAAQPATRAQPGSVQVQFVVVTFVSGGSPATSGSGSADRSVGT